MISLTDSSRVFSPSNAASSVSPSSSRESDPISSLLSQLSGVRRATAASSAPTQLQQLQSQLQFERAQMSSTGRSGRRQNSVRDTGCSTAFPMSMFFLNTAATSAPQQPTVSPSVSAASVSQPSSPSNFLLSNAFENMSNEPPDYALLEERREFLQQLCLSTLEQSFHGEFTNRLEDGATDNEETED